MRNYDEPAVVARLSKLGRREKSAFAASCAQRLVPVFERYARSVGNADLGSRLATIVASAWDLASGEVPDKSPERLQAEAEALVPSDEDGWTLEMGYGQNAAAAAAYAIRAWLTDDPQEAAWAARQVYEMADYAVLQRSPTLDLNEAASELTVLSSALVQDALEALDRSLTSVESSGNDWSTLRASSEADGLRWARAVP